MRFQKISILSHPMTGHWEFQGGGGELKLNLNFKKVVERDGGGGGGGFQTRSIHWQVWIFLERKQ